MSAMIPAGNKCFGLYSENNRQKVWHLKHHHPQYPWDFRILGMRYANHKVPHYYKELGYCSLTVPWLDIQWIVPLLAVNWHSIQRGFLTSPSLLFSGYQRLSPVVKWLEHEADHSPPSRAWASNNHGRELQLLLWAASWATCITFTVSGL